MRWLPFVLPPLYFVFLLGIMPTDRLGHPLRTLQQGHRFFFDDYDAAAYMLRGVNANLGRQGGLPDEPPFYWPDDFNLLLDQPPPLADRYFLEYPHLMLWVFQGAASLADLPGPLTVPNPVLDGRQHNLVWHTPRNDAERAVWAAFRRGIVVVFAFSMLLTLANLVVVRWGLRLGESIPPIWLMVLPSSLYFGLNRMDVLPSLFVVLAFAAIFRRRSALSGALLALACLVKVYPVLLGPLFVRYLWQDRRRLRSFLLAGFAAGFALLGGMLVLYGWEAVLAPYRFQMSREPLPGWTLYGIVLPEFLGERSLGVLRFGVVAVVLLALLRRPIKDVVDLLKRSVVVLIVFANLQVFYSPQWIWWFFPLLAALAVRDRKLIRLVVAFDLLTYLSFPLVCDELDSPWEGVVRPMLVWGRVALSLAIVYRLNPWQRTSEISSC